MKKLTFPHYVKIKEIALRLNGNGKVKANYFRDAGYWGIQASFIDGKLIANCHSGDENVLAHVNGLELVPISKKEWEEDNHGYI